MLAVPCIAIIDLASSGLPYYLIYWIDLGFSNVISFCLVKTLPMEDIYYHVYTETILFLFSVWIDKNYKVK